MLGMSYLGPKLASSVFFVVMMTCSMSSTNFNTRSRPSQIFEVHSQKGYKIADAGRAQLRALRREFGWADGFGMPLT